MAENYFPKSSQVGQGGAQVLSGRASQVDMSGYVRGLENLATGIQQNIEYKRGVEALKQKEKNAQIASLNENITELQIPTFKKLAKQEFNNFWESVNKGEDWQPAFNTVMENISSLQAADNSMVKDRDKILEGEFRYEDGTRLQGGEVYSGLFEKEVPEDIMSIYKEGGVEAVVGSVLENTSTMSPNYYEQFKGGFDFNNEIGKYWATKLKNQGVESAKQIELGNDLTAAKVYRSLDGDDAIKAKSELIQDEAAKEFYFRNTALPYKTMNPEEKQKMWEEVVEQMIPPSTVDVTAIRNKPEEGGGKPLRYEEVFNTTISDESGIKTTQTEEDVRSGGVPSEEAPQEESVFLGDYENIKVMNLGLKVSPAQGQTEIPIKVRGNTVMTKARPEQVINKDGELFVVYSYEDPKRGGSVLTQPLPYKEEIVEGTKITPETNLNSRYEFTEKYFRDNLIFDDTQVEGGQAQQNQEPQVGTTSDLPD